MPFNNSSMLCSMLYTFLAILNSISAHQIPLQAPSSHLSTASADDSLVSTLPKPTRPLQWGTLNILSTTDTHGWLRGHTHSSHIPEALYSASIADVASFHEHLSKKADELGVDLLLVDSGDTVDGNGFVDADTSGVKGHMARKLLQQVGYDIATVGNHELYNYTVAYDVYKNYIPSFLGHYLSSNINITLPNSSKNASVPYGNRYLRFQTKNQKLNITAFGVLFGFDRAADGLKVQSVLEMMQEGWWKEVMGQSGDTDVFVLLGHMATKDKDWLLVLNSIRTYYPTKPVLIFSGHAHVRDCIRPDPYTQVLASGRYMETLGFTSVTLPSSSSKLAQEEENHHHPFFTSLTAEQESNPLQITRRYLDNNIASYLYHSNTTLDSFHTEKGKKMQDEMDGYAKSFNLSFTFGYAPQSYYLNRYPMTHEKSLIKLYADKVFNTVVVERRKHSHRPSFPSSDSSGETKEDVVEKSKKKEVQPAFLFNTGGARFDMFKGPFTRDDQFTVIPFDNQIWAVEKGLDYDLILAVVEWLNSRWGEPEFIQSILDHDKNKESSDAEFEAMNGIGEHHNEEWRAKSGTFLMDSLNTFRHRQGAADDYAIYSSSIQGEVIQEADEDEEEEDEPPPPEQDKRKKKPKLTFGYVTKDKCGPHGDDIPHRPLPAYPIPEFVLSTRPSGPSGSITPHVHLVFYEFIAPLVLAALNDLQQQQVFSYSNLTLYSDFKANELLGEYAKLAWAK